MQGSRHALAGVLLSALVFAGCSGARAPATDSTTTAERSTASASSSAPSPVATAGDAENQGSRATGDAALAVEGDQGTPSTSSAAQAPRASFPPAAEIALIDEAIYFPGARTRPKGSAVEASLDDEIVATWNRGGLSAEPTTGPKGKPSHAAPRVKVDVIDIRGDANEADMQRAARLKSYWPFRICYEQGLRRMQKLHGTIKLRLTIGPSGRPSGVQQVATELGDAGVVSCVVKSAMGLGLPAPSSGAPQITLDISLWPGDEPVSIKSGPPGKNVAPAEAKAISDQLRTRLAEARTCYAAGLARHDGLWGRIGLALHITVGVVDEVNEVESRFPDPDVTECVRKVFLHAAVPSTDRELTIVYPLRLGHAPDGRDARR
jgi:hypothetical protein